MKKKPNQEANVQTNDTVAGGGNSVFAHLAGEGPVLEGDSEDQETALAQQEADPTILSADLKDEGMPKRGSKRP